MEKTTKNRIVKKPEYYSEEFKWQVVQEVLTGFTNLPVRDFHPLE
ncbi:MAG: hypothetical protein ACJARP_003291 [Vicingaceae bacterium]|jgi:hypothetical protein